MCNGKIKYLKPFYQKKTPKETERKSKQNPQSNINPEKGAAVPQ